MSDAESLNSQRVPDSAAGQYAEFGMDSFAQVAILLLPDTAAHFLQKMERKSILGLQLIQQLRRRCILSTGSMDHCTAEGIKG